MADLNEASLMDFGLSINESKVYLALLKSGSSVIGEISNGSGVHMTNVYDAIKRLIEKNLVTYIFKGNKRYYAPSDPSQILFMLQEKEEKFKKILPNLLIHKKYAKKDKASIYEGIRGIKAITDDILKRGEDVVTFGVPYNTVQLMGSFVGIYHKKRIKLGINQKHLYNENAKERISALNKMKHTQARYLPKEYDSPATTTVYGNKVAFWLWGDIPISILIESERMAISYRKYFKLLWKLAKKK